LLCWRSDEESVAYYHGPEGYAGRRPIPESCSSDTGERDRSQTEVKATDG
jgi:hypothetical protein